jgi:transposase InsO family protein
MAAVNTLAPRVGMAAACEALGVARASYYRAQARADGPAMLPRRARPPLALSEAERQQVLAVLHSERFVDQAPPTIYATLLDEGQYLCSVRTMYRLLAEADEVRERRNQCRRPVYTKPELLATAPNQVWSWDITKLKGPEQWTYFYLYVILASFSRYVVGWLVAARETAALAKRLIAESCHKQAIPPQQLTLHADRGSSMTSKTVAQRLADLDVTRSHSRPSVSDDNPYSEAQFKTLKYRPQFPQRFGSLEHARAHCQTFFPWYNTVHRHSGIAFLTPEQVHYGLAEAALEVRAQTLRGAFDVHPERFKGRLPRPQPLPKAVWINPPDDPTKREPGQPGEETELLQ